MIHKYRHDFIKADISTLNLNDKITIEDLKDENYSFIHPDNMVVCQVKMSRASMSLETETEEEEGEEGEEGSTESESKSDASAESGESKEENKEDS